jgi:hypothetical protein
MVVSIGSIEGNANGKDLYSQLARTHHRSRADVLAGHLDAGALMTNRRSVLAVAAQVYDKDELSERDQTFLDAISKAGRDWSDALTSANIQFGGGSVAWQAVKNLATRQRDQEYARALAALEAHDDQEIEQLQAAE